MDTTPVEEEDEIFLDITKALGNKKNSSQNNTKPSESLTPVPKQSIPTSVIAASTSKSVPRPIAKVGGPKRKKDKDSVKHTEMVEIPKKMTKDLFTSFVTVKVSKDAMEAVYESANKFWKQLGEDLESLSEHAGRKTINKSDFELLMKKNGLIDDKNSLNDLIREHLPREMQEELIQIAKAHNVIVPSKK